VNGSSLRDIDYVADPGKNFVVIMQGEKIYKNTIN